MKRLIFLLLCLWSLTCQGQTRINLFTTSEDLVIWRARAISGPYKVVGDAGANSPGDWKRVDDNATSFRNNPNNDRYTNAYTGTGYVPRGEEYAPKATNGQGAGIRLRDCAFRYLIKQQAADAAAVITGLKNTIDQTIPDGPDVGSAPDLAFDWNNTVRWARTKPTNFQDLAPGFPIAEWLTKLLIAAECVEPVMSDADSIKIYQWFSDGAYYMIHNFEEDANDLFVNRLAGNYTIHPGTPYTRENDAADVKQLYSTSVAIGPKVHYIARHYSNRRATMVSYILRAGVALNDPYLINLAKRWITEMYRFSVDDLGNYCDFHRGISDNNTSKPHAYSTMYNIYAAIDELALSGDRSLYELPHLTPSILRLCDMRNHTVNLYASLTPTSNSALILDGHGTILDLGFAMANRFLRNTTIQQTYLRTHAGSVAYPANPASAGSDITAAVLGSYPASSLMFANMENVNDRYGQAETDPGEDTTVVPPPLPPPPIVSHWLQASDTVTITANTHILNYVKEKALDSDTTGIASRYVTAHSGSDTLTYLFNSARGLDSLQIATGRDRFDAEQSYRVEYKHSGSWASVLDVTANSNTYNRYNINVPTADGVRFIFRDTKTYTRVKYAGVKISAPF